MKLPYYQFGTGTPVVGRDDGECPVYYAKGIGTHLWVADGLSCNVRMVGSAAVEVFRTTKGIARVTLSEDERGERGGEEYTAETILGQFELGERDYRVWAPDFVPAVEGPRPVAVPVVAIEVWEYPAQLTDGLPTWKRGSFEELAEKHGRKRVRKYGRIAGKGETYELE